MEWRLETPNLEELDTLCVSELMTRHTLWVGPGDSVADAARLMAERSYSCAVVCEKDLPVGILTERDVVRWVGEGLDLAATIAGDVMSAPVITVEETASLEFAVAETSARQIRRLVVVAPDGTIRGVVTQSDLLRAHSRELERLVDERTRLLQSANAELQRLVRIDTTLGVGNRRALESDLHRLHETATRYERPYSVAVLDLDHFKVFNDTHGHRAGDATLRWLCAMLAGLIRRADAVYRLGGDELLILMPETPLDGATKLVDRARETIAGSTPPFEVEGVKISVSAGVAELPRGAVDCPSAWDTVERADQALLRAKRGGRNRVEQA